MRQACAAHVQCTRSACVQGPSLNEVARLDTCVTVVDAAEFNSNLETVRVGKRDSAFEGTFTELMVEQIEYANVIVLNKEDLVTKSQLTAILDQINLLNPNANVITSQESKIDVMAILDTRLFNAGANIDESLAMRAMKTEATEVFEENECCKKSLKQGAERCCNPQTGQTVDSGMSQVLLFTAAGRNPGM